MNTYDMTIGELTVKMVAEARRLGYSEANHLAKLDAAGWNGCQILQRAGTI